MTESEEKSEKTTSTVSELRRWSGQLVSLVRDEVRPFAVLLIILLIGLFFLSRGEGSRDIIRYLGGAIVLGLIFVVGVGYEWSSAHFSPRDHVEGGMFFFMTGMHALHVITGIILLLLVFYNGRRGIYSRERHWGVEATALYWHFVDVVWVFFYVALYLIGDVVHG